MGTLLLRLVKTSCLFTIGIFLNPNLFAQSVKKVNKKKGVIMIDESIPKGTKVCVMNDGKKVACGSVRKSQKNSSIVKIKNKKKLKKIKKGMSVEVSGGGGSSIASSAIGKGKKGSTKTRGMAFNFGWAPAILPPVAYEIVSYKAPGTGTIDSMWQSTGQTELQLMSISFGYEYYFNQSMGLGVGGRFKSPPPSQIDDDFSTDPTRANEYVENITSYSAFSFNLTFNYVIDLSTSSFLKINSGVDIEMGTLAFTATKLDDNDAGIASEFASSNVSLMLMSLRVDTIYTLMLSDTFGIDFGLGLLLPMSASATYSTEVDGVAANSQLADEDNAPDLEETINAGAATFGLELIMGASVVF